MDKILTDTGIENLDYGVNLAYSPEMNAQAAQESLPMYLGMILIFISGYLIIYNIFQISVTSDIRFFGRLKTLGALSKQIQKIILNQSARLCLVGIPIGLVLGYVAGSLLVPIMLGMIEEEVFVAANPIIFIGSAIFAGVTVLISSLRPAHLAGKVSPMDALRCTDVENGKRKHKKSKKGASVCAMAWSNLGRNKKRTAMVICSLSLGLILLCCFYAKNTAYDQDKYLEGEIIADFEFADATHEDNMNGYNPQGNTLNKELLDQTNSLDGLEASGSMYTHQFSWEMDDQTVENLTGYYNKERIEEWKSYHSAGAEALEKAVEQKQVEAILYGLEGIPLDAITREDHILDGEYNADLFAEGNYVIAISSASGDSIGDGNDVIPASAVGSQITMEGEVYTVMAVVESLMPVEAMAMEAGRTESFSLDFIIPADAFCSKWLDNTIRKLYVNEAESASQPVTGNAISIVIALVGILNFVNSMVSDGFSTYRFTLLPLYICTPILLVFAVLIPIICFRKLGKQSIVEQLRAVD